MGVIDFLLVSMDEILLAKDQGPYHIQYLEYSLYAKEPVSENEEDG